MTPGFIMQSSATRCRTWAGMLALGAALSLGLFMVGVVQAQGSKVGFVNTERILRDSAPAKAAQKKIEAEFKKRDNALQSLASTFRTKAEKFERDAIVLSESDRAKRQRELANLDADLQRKRREFQEDFNRRRNEEFAGIVEKANVAIKRIAETENYDLILQDAVTVNPRNDITDKVIRNLDK
jgi:outer membrane protein